MNHDPQQHPDHVHRARALRSDRPEVEGLLWSKLRSNQTGFKFRRQHPFDPYVLDFYCPEKKLAIEVDGEGHSMGDQPMRDARKDGFLKKHGVRVLRFSAETVFRDMDAVVLTILAEVGG